MVHIDGMASARIRSLDVVRGAMLVVSVVCSSLLAQPEWFSHAAWEGVHPIDLVFPVFVTLTGCGLGFALHRRVRLVPVLRRVAVLLVAGLLYNAVATDVWRLDDWWFTGVLQLYAAVVAVLALLHLVTRSWWGWALVTGGFSASYAVLLAVFATGCPGRALVPACNPSGVVDPIVFGLSHIYHQGSAGHDPVGLIALSGAVISASAGATVGHLLLSVRGARGGGGVAAAILPLLAAAGGFALLGAATVVIPDVVWGVHPLVMKRLWTPPFALWVASGAATALLVAHLAVDRSPPDRVVAALSAPLGLLGRHSLLVYFGSHAAMAVLTRPRADGTTSAAEFAQSLAPLVGGDGQLALSVATVAIWFGAAALAENAGRRSAQGRRDARAGRDAQAGMRRMGAVRSAGV